MLPVDVPSPIDFHLMSDAQEWERTAMDRPFRLDMFARILEALNASGAKKILELGSGPGFLAEYLLRDTKSLELTLLDFSDPMHQLARKRLGKYIDNIKFVKRDFKESCWSKGLGKFDAVVVNQAIHELRHKSYACTFHRQVKELLNPRATYLVCDHFFGEGGMTNDQLFMTIEEQLQSLEDAGYKPTMLLKKGSLVMLQAR